MLYSSSGFFYPGPIGKVQKGNLSNHTLFVQVAEGPGDMPQWVDVLTEEEIWTLTQYHHSMKCELTLLV